MLDPNEEKLLEETYLVEKENNEMLHKLYNNMWMSRMMSIFYWVVILGLMVGSFYYAQPYVQKLISMYDQASRLLPQIKQ